MADEFHLGSGNWWETPSTTSFDTPVTTLPLISTTLNSIPSFGWPPEIKTKSSIDSAASSSLIQHGRSQSSTANDAPLLANPEFQIMGFGLSSQTHSMDWNQTFVRSEKPESSFRADSDFSHDSRRNPATQEHWSSQKIYGGASPEDSSVNDFRRMNLGFSSDQSQFSSQSSSNESTTTSQNLSAYSLLLQENQEHQNLPMMNYAYSGAECLPSWNNYYPFIRTSPSRPTSVGGHLHFTNNTTFWNSSPSMAENRPILFSDPQRRIPAPPSYTEKIKTTSENTKKTRPETSTKRSRSESSSPLPALKVRKEKVGDRISALQQLVSPFGKTDTASVLSEAIEYIKYLHDQITVLTTPYLKNGAPTQIQNQQNIDTTKEERPDLRSRGLCLVSVSSTFPLGHESSVDFWTPTFGVGSTFR